MVDKINKRVCPVERAGGLDNSLRRLFQNPGRILKSYIKSGMTVLDIGCGPGFFSIEIAKMLKGSGIVIAADLQEGMLDKVSKKISGTNVEKSIKLHKCSENEIRVSERVDFVLAFYMIHEVPDKEKLFREIKSILKPGGLVFIAEPAFHVSKTEFDKMTGMLNNTGFQIIDRPKILFSRTVLITQKKLSG